MIPGPTGTYTYWDWPPSANGDGYSWFEWTVTPRTDPTPDGYFWSHQFWLVGGPAGYCGLQTVGSEPRGKIAIFSIWDAESATGPEFAAPFTGEGDGYSVRIQWPWMIGRAYRMRVEAAGESQWTAAVDKQPIGNIRVPSTWQGLSSTSVMWTERYHGGLRSLDQIHRSEVLFGEPAAGHVGADRVAPIGHRNLLADPPGSLGSSIDDVAGGVVQVMGGTP